MVRVPLDLASMIPMPPELFQVSRYSLTLCPWSFCLMALKWVPFKIPILSPVQGPISFEIFVWQFLLLHHKSEVPICHNIAKICYTSWNLCSNCPKMWSILLRDTGEFVPCVFCSIQMSMVAYGSILMLFCVRVQTWWYHIQTCTRSLVTVVQVFRVTKG